MRTSIEAMLSGGGRRCLWWIPLLQLRWIGFISDTRVLQFQSTLLCLSHTTNTLPPVITANPYVRFMWQGPGRPTSRQG